MIWLTPKNGTTREIVRFAWLPTILADEITVVWFRKYVSVEQRVVVPTKGGRLRGHWRSLYRRLP